MSLFSPLSGLQALVCDRKRCPIKDLSAKSCVIYQDLSANRGPSDRQPEVPQQALVMQQDMNKHMMTTSRFASSALALAAAIAQLRPSAVLPFTGTCPIAYDGQELTYRFRGKRALRS